VRDTTRRQMIDVRRFREGLHGLSDRTPFSFPVGSVPRHFRRAAVLLPFWEEGGDIRVALIRRAESLRVHPGEVAFAGGIVDPGESFVEAAVREAVEEIDLDPISIDFLGRLDDAWSGLGHHIAPVVAWLSVPPKLTPNPAEVAEVLTAPVSEILLPAALERRLGRSPLCGTAARSHRLGIGRAAVLGARSSRIDAGEARDPEQRESLKPMRIRHSCRRHPRSAVRSVRGSRDGEFP